MKTEETTITTGNVLTADGIKIAYDRYSRGHQRVLILAHGFFNSKQSVLFKNMARALVEGHDVIAMDFRGHGKSGGFFDWTAKECQDLEAVLGYAQEYYKKIGVIGFSLGAATSIITASKSDRINSLIAVSAPSQFNKIDFQLWKMGIMENIYYNVFQEGRIGKGIKPGKPWLKKTKPIDVVGRIKIPILFVQGDHDWLIQPWHAQKLYERATSPNKKLEIIKSGTHAEYLFRSYPELMIKIINEWFKKTMF